MQARYYQDEAENAVFDYWQEEAGNPLVDLATGCHAAGTKILMYDGTTKSVELVAVNDNIMGPDSKPRRVLRTVSGREMMYRVTPKKGDPFIVNEGHILSLKTTNEGKKAQKYPNTHTAGGEIENITVAEYLAKTKSWKHLRKLWRVGVDFNYAANDNLPVPAYIVGALLGDGSLTNNVGITNMDHQVLDEVCDYAESVGVNARVTQKAGNKAWQVFFPDDLASRSTRNRLVAQLELAGVWGMTCAEKGIPHVYKTGSRNTRLNVLAGLLDTDGHLSGGNNFDFISKSKTLSNDVAFVARSLGLAAYVNPCMKFCQTGGGGEYWRVNISGDTNIIPNRVDRQKASPRRQIKNPLVTGFSIEPIGEGDYYGFALDGDHLYLTEDFTVHHNTGKSYVMANLIKRLAVNWPDMRIMVATHVAELIEQNYLELLGVWPFAPAGIYSAGLGRRDAHSQIIFAGIQTVHNKVKQIGHIDVLMVDECHLIPINSNTMYRKFIEALKEVNPDLKVLGLTATPYRLDSGRIDEGDDRLFDRVVYTYGVGDGIRDGFLAPLTSKPTATEYDVKGVGKLGGDYKQNALEAAINRPDLNEEVVREIVAKGADRRSWLCFCAGVKSALDVRDEFRRQGISCETVTGDTPKEERRRILEDFKSYKLRCVTNNSVLTTGFNHKGVDLLAFMRPTLSLSLYIQMAGRGTRPLYAANMPLDTPEERIAAIKASPKPNCLVLDFAKLVNKHGPVDMVEPKTPSKGDGEAPIKICPQESGGCGEKVHISLMKCPACDYEFPPNEEEKLTRTAADAPIVSTAEAEWRDVTRRSFAFHEGKGDKPPSVKVTYMTGLTPINEWLCPQHSGFAQSKAHRWWTQHGGQRPFPKTVMEWLERQNELNDTAEISVVPNGKYWNVTSHKAGLVAAAMTGDNDNVPDWMAELDDEIPF